MALAKKCDRCGNLYEPKDMDVCGAIVNGLSLIDRDEQNSRAVSRRYFDLCPECLVISVYLVIRSLNASIGGTAKLFTII